MTEPGFKPESAKFQSLKLNPFITLIFNLVKVSNKEPHVK